MDANLLFILIALEQQVELIEMQKRILPMEDAEISDALKENFIASGINVHNNSKVTEYRKIKN